MFTRKYILSLGKLSLCIVTGEIIVNCLIVATLSIDSDRINIGQDFNRCIHAYCCQSRVRAPRIHMMNLIIQWSSLFR